MNCVMSDETQTIRQVLEERERKGYARGFADADRKWRGRLMALAKEEGPNSFSPLKVVLTHEEERAVSSAKATVLKVVEAHPNGLTGVGIVAAIRSIGLDIPERTIRTSLRRLRYKDKRISQENGMWFPLPAKENEEVLGTPPR